MKNKEVEDAEKWLLEVDKLKKELKQKNRELEIEAALERVRARTMAMQKSEELADVALVLFQQVKQLSIETWSTGFNIWQEGETSYIDWVVSTAEGRFMKPYTVDLTVHPFFIEISKAKKRGDDFFVIEAEGETLAEHYRLLFKMAKIQFEDLVNAGFQMPEHQINHYVFGKQVSLMFITFEQCPEAHDIFKRLGKAFEQTYTRFLDLKKAEAQAREAEIEAALERVRARMMAMQKYDDLLGVLKLLADQLVKLGIPLEIANFSDGLPLPGADWNLWFYMNLDGDSFLDSVTFPHTDHPFSHRIEAAIDSYTKGGSDLNKEVFTKEEKDAWIEYSFTQPKFADSPQEMKQYLLDKPGHAWSAVFLKDTWVSIIKNISVPFTDEEDALLRRFANIFGQTYTRFLDLKNAEAQAREAQIEAALERIRSKSLGMRKSDELQEVVSVVFEQLQALNFALDGAAFIATRIKEFKGFDFWMEDKITQPARFRLPYYDAPSINDFYDAWDDQKDFISKIYGQEKNLWFDYAFEHTDLKLVPEDRKKWILSQTHLTQAFAIQKNSMIGIHVHHAKTLTEDEIDILKRVSKVFEQAYIRFLDLQKAEAQAREAQIEAALERVRSRTMGMQRSDELQEAAVLLFQQVIALGVPAFATGFNIWDDDRKSVTAWMGGQDRMQPPFKTSGFEDIFFRIHEAAEKGESLFVEEQGGEALKTHYEYMLSIPVFKGIADKMAVVGQSFPTFQIMHCAFFSHGYLMFITFEPVPDAYDIFKRFAKVFEQTYTRFLDLQKAEAQAREAQIEASLERVRAKAMAMHNTKDISEATAIVFIELKQLGINMIRAGIIIFNETPVAEVWSTRISPKRNQTIDIVTGNLNMDIHPMLQNSYRGWKNKKEYFTYELTGDEVLDYYKLLGKEPEYHFPKTDKYPSRQILSTFNFKEGGIFAYTKENLTEEAKQILHRFTKVFSLTYRRYQDLINTEAQAREAQIEAALERVRSKSIAMRKSEEIADVAAKIFSELRQLDLALNRVLIWTFNDAEKYTTWWSANPEVESTAESYRIDYNENPVFINYLQAWQQRKPIHLFTLSGDTKKTWEDHLFEHTEMSRLPMEVRKGMRAESTLYTVSVISDYGLMMSGSFEPLPEASIDIIQRFGRVFQQSYTRYLDVQKAEAQARKAEIEMSLERVRAKAMAMRTSSDIPGAVAIVFKELSRLGIEMERNGIVLISDKTPVMEVWSTPLSAQDQEEVEIITGLLDSRIHPLLQGVYDTWKSGGEYFCYELIGEEVQKYYELLKNVPDYRFPTISKYSDFQVGNGFLFKEGQIFVFTKDHLSDEEKEIFKRFTNVFSLTYRRYLDLINAELRAKEAIKQASLDRVRGEIASMRTSKDLNRITPVIWKELQALEVPFIRCGVFIVDEKNEITHVYLSTPEGKALGVLNLKFNANELTKNTVEHWRNKRIFRTHWNKEDFVKWTRSMMDIGQVKSAETYQGASAAPASLDLHFVPFRQGMLYVGDVSPLTIEKIDLVRTLAEAFSIAYARYEDFKNLEEAKNKIESTLNELRSTQAQLIQAEKMASLGELTAGIAHEIQNPLNFVNNFSELSTELLEELKEEIDKGDFEEVKSITADVIQNLGKILHHGKRAESIVKGMLLHSRGSSGQKEPTDINAMADECLRLSYHGFRAKDKSFNADFKLEADESLPKVNVVPQDIGRVFLNLINNAFYAAPMPPEGGFKDPDYIHKPLVIIKTSYIPPSGAGSDKSGGQRGACLISVKDNGPGIPESVKEKIFQPFFTTKPTGQGTGLGLSLSYDIVKAHGGEIKVVSQPVGEEGNENEARQDDLIGRGTAFIITLPLG